MNSMMVLVFVFGVGSFETPELECKNKRDDFFTEGRKVEQVCTPKIKRNTDTDKFFSEGR